jgi:filamentous hemagglutinin family protein
MRLRVTRRKGPFYRLHQAVRLFMAFLMLVFQFAPLAALANPQGEQVVAGSASFDRGGSTLTIHTSHRVIINWQDFSIQSGELTKFVQPSASSAALNRVVSGNPSAIYGTLQANGQIFLINPNGILVGGGAVIDTGGFIASTFDVANDQFLAGGQMNFMGGSTAAIENQGTINAIGGDIILIAHEVNNSGTLNASGGTVGLAAGHDVLFTQSGQERVFIRPTASTAPASGQGIVNSGVIDAARVELKAHGNLYALAINNTGVVRAQGATVGEDGRVFLTANGGAVKVGGTIEARGLGGSGGMVTVAAERVEISDALIDASGETGGGSVSIGGGYQGKDAAIENSKETMVSANTVIKADATVQGDGGNVVVWSDGTTKFGGTISARGAGAGGNGGNAEVSGKELLYYNGFTDLRADSGVTGTLLLDPKNIVIDSAGGAVPGDVLFGDNIGSTVVYSGASVSLWLATANLTLQANNDITVQDNITALGAGNDLTLQAGRTISIDADISLNGGNFSATVNDSNAVFADRDAGLASFTMLGGSEILTNDGDITINHGNLDGSGSGAVSLSGATLNAGNGQINITGTGSGSGISLTNSSELISNGGSGGITLTGTGGGGSPGIFVSGGANSIGGASLGGVITLAAETTAGSDSISLSNMSIEGTGLLFMNPLNTATGVGIAGGSGDFNLSGTELDLIADGFTKITIGRDDGTGTVNVGTYTFADSVKIQSHASAGDGAINVTGALATSGAGDTIELYAGKMVTVSGGSVTSNDGNIAIAGNVNDTYAAWTMGVDFNSNATVSSGNGDILVVGNGGDGAGDWKIGIRNQGSTIQSTGGDITFQGSGGSTDSFNPGILIEWGGGSVTTDSGNILLVGNGGGQGGNNWGISVSDGGAVTATGAGTVTLSGTGGDGTDVNYGVKITGSGVVSVDSGDLQITGTVGSPTDQWNHGVDMDTGGQVLSDNGGKITINGIGGAGTRENHGVRIADNNTLVQSTTGDILINGLGGAGSQEGNRGILVEGGADVQSTGSAKITLDGDGGLGTFGNHGIIIAGSGTTITSSGGDIFIDGLGADSAGGWNNGVWIFAGAHIDASNAAAVAVSGLAGNAGANGDNWGVMFEGAGTRITAVDGDIALSGIGRGTTDQNNVGLYMRNDVEVSSTGAGNFFFSGSGGDTAAGIVVNGGSNVFGGPSATGGMTFTAHTASGSDSISLSNATFQSSGALTFQPLDPATSIGVAGGAGTFNLSSAELDLFQNGFSLITIGRANGTGAVDVGAYTFNDPLKIQSNAAGGGGVITVNGALATSTGGDGIELYAGRGVVLNAGLTTDGGDVTIKGNESGTVTGFSFGVDVISSTISTGTGNIDIVGKAGDDLGSNFGIGVRLTTGARLETTSGDITVNGTGNPSGDSFNWGVLMEWASTTVQSSSGEISLTGTGGGTGNENYGILIQGTSQVSNNTGGIDIMGTASSAGTSNNYGIRVDFSDIISTDGDIVMTGLGGGTGNDNYGIFLQNGATVTSNNDATITLVGTGADGTWWNVGTYIVNAGTAITSTTGDIDITGYGGNGLFSENFGLLVAGGAVIQSAGAAEIELTGTGGNGTWGNHGLAVLDPGSSITTVDGDITMIGTGGAGSQGWNVGLRLQNGVLVQSTGAGELNLTGTATGGVEDNWGFWAENSTVTSLTGDISITGTGAGTAQTNYGIFLNSNNLIESTGAATVTLNGTGGDGTWWNLGAYIIDNGTIIRSATGDISITGNGGNGSQNENFGILVAGNSLIESTGTAEITMTGTGGDGSWGNHGIVVYDPNSTVTTVDGDITMIGTGGAGSQGWNVGLRLQNGALVQSTGAGEINLTGNGTAGAEDNWGFWMNNAQVISASADINITGTGDGTAQTNYGISMENASVVENTGAGNVTLIGTGGDGDWGNHGVFLINSGTEVCVEDGNLLILGNGGNGFGGFNLGVRIDDFAAVEACNNGSVTIQGIAGNGTDDNWGIWGYNGLVTSISGDITITGLGGGTGNNNYGIYLELGTSIVSYDVANITLDGRGAGAAEGIRSPSGGGNFIGGFGMLGDITLIADTVAGLDSINISGADVVGQGALVMQPLNANTSIGLGGGAGVFNLDGADLAQLQAGFTQITIGQNNGTGALDIGAATFQDAVSIYGGTTTITGPLDAGANNLLVKARGSLTLGGTVTADNATLVTSSSFVNTAGPAPFFTTGRFLIYSVKPSQNTLGGLVTDFEQFGISYPTAPSKPGDGLLYSESATNPLIAWALNVLLPKFVDNDDRYQHYDTDLQSFPNFYPNGGSMGYGSGGPDVPSFQDVLAQFSSFDLSKTKKVEDEDL